MEWCPLHAAAPEMLTSLQELLEVLNYWWAEEALSGADTFDPMRRARALLARVEGA
jgi:hypothetical protein